MYTFISHHMFLRQENGFGICFDERPEYCITRLYKISLVDFFPLTLFNSIYTRQEIIDILEQSNYGEMNGTEWFEYLAKNYSDILSTSDERGMRKNIVVINKYLGIYATKEVPNKLAFPIMASIRLNN